MGFPHGDGPELILYYILLNMHTGTHQIFITEQHNANL